MAQYFGQIPFSPAFPASPEGPGSPCCPGSPGKNNLSYKY